MKESQNLALIIEVSQLTNIRQERRIKKERNKFINTVKNYAYPMLTAFADPS